MTLGARRFTVKNTVNTSTREQTPRLSNLKRKARDTGLPYTSMRDAGLRGEFPLVRIGRALYVENRDIDRWIETRKQG